MGYFALRENLKNGPLALPPPPPINTPMVIAVAYCRPLCAVWALKGLNAAVKTFVILSFQFSRSITFATPEDGRHSLWTTDCNIC